MQTCQKAFQIPFKSKLYLSRVLHSPILFKIVSYQPANFCPHAKYESVCRINGQNFVISNWIETLRDEELHQDKSNREMKPSGSLSIKFSLPSPQMTTLLFLGTLTGSHPSNIKRIKIQNCNWTVVDFV